MRTTVSVLLAVCTIGLVALGQSQVDLSKRYKPINGYEVRPGLLLLPQFDSDGEVCTVTIARFRPTSDGSTPDSPFTNEIADALVDEISPASVRGRANEWLNPDSMIISGTYFDRKDYENVSVERNGVVGGELRSLKIIWTKRRCAIQSEDRHLSQ